MNKGKKEKSLELDRRERKEEALTGRSNPVSLHGVGKKGSINLPDQEEEKSGLRRNESPEKEEMGEPRGRRSALPLEERGKDLNLV